MWFSPTERAAAAVYWAAALVGSCAWLGPWGLLAWPAVGAIAVCGAMGALHVIACRGDA